MTAESVPEPLNRRKGGVVVIEHLSTAITLVPLIQCQKFYDFLKAYKETFQTMCLNPTFRRGPNLSLFFRPWTVGYNPVKLANTFISQIRTLMVPFERSFSKLSENQKIVEIGSTEFKL